MMVLFCQPHKLMKADPVFKAVFDWQTGSATAIQDFAFWFAPK